jgi:hypothetical protein
VQIVGYINTNKDLLHGQKWRSQLLFFQLLCESQQQATPPLSAWRKLCHLMTQKDNFRHLALSTFQHDGLYQNELSRCFISFWFRSGSTAPCTVDESGCGSDRLHVQSFRLLRRNASWQKSWYRCQLYMWSKMVKLIIIIIIIIIIINCNLVVTRW